MAFVPLVGPFQGCRWSCFREARVTVVCLEWSSLSTESPTSRETPPSGQAGMVGCSLPELGLCSRVLNRKAETEFGKEKAIAVLLCQAKEATAG